LTKAEEELAVRRAAERWDRTAQDRASDPLQGWLDSPIVLERYLQPRISGSADVNWLVGLAQRLRIPRGGRWLSLGCGTGDQEIIAGKAQLFSSLVALDASAQSLEEGRRRAAASGVTSIEFGSVNLDSLDLPPSAFDVVLMNMSLHHVKQLRLVLSRVDRALRPNGFFLINEFVGPRQFQFTDLQLGLVRELLDDLPSAWRRQRGGEIKTEYVRLPVEHWNRADPSEAIRSDRIIPEVERRFRVVERIDYGGTLLDLLLEHIVHNFDSSNEKDVAAVRLLARVEDVLIRAGVLPSDFTVMALRKKRGPFRFVHLPRVSAIRDAFARLLRPAVLAPRVAQADVIDFREGPHSAALVSGFHHWEGASRWMSRRAELILRMTSNRIRVVLANPSPRGRPAFVRVRLIEESTGRAKNLGLLRLEGSAREISETLQVPDNFASLGYGQSLRVVLRSSNAWIPAKEIAGSEDFRELTVQVFRVGFEKAP
jgi:ubiquinone/menaquinone biosynthesis C-methylase UbiE